MTRLQSSADSGFESNAGGELVGATGHHSQTLRLEAAEVGRVGRCQRHIGVQGNRGNLTVDERTATTSGGVEQLGRTCSVVLVKSRALRDNLCCQLNVRRIYRSAQELRPGDSAHRERVTAAQPFSERLVLRGAGH